MGKYIEKLKRYYTEDLKQKQAVTESLVQKILFSKRLLVDHVEALEQCMEHINDASKALVLINEVDNQLMQQIQNSKIITSRNACILLGSTLLQNYILPRSFRFVMVPSVILTSGVGAICLVKSVFMFRNKIVERELEQLIKTIDDFGNCIRRNMTYFNEIIIMKQQELIESRQIERAWDCITAAKEVTEILYEATRKLEADYPLPAKFSQYYAPLEELKDSEFFKNNVTNYSPKNIKDFHNIFAYIQSQYLLRLALTIYTKPSLSQLNADLMKIECLIRQLVQEEENHFKNLAIEQKKKIQFEVQSLNETKTMQNRSGPVALLQDSSLKLSARMVAVAAECQALDINLRKLTEVEAVAKNNAKHLVEIANTMRSIESALSVCFDDYQRLMLIYNKFLNSKIEEEDDRKEKAAKELENNKEFPEDFLRVEISNNSNELEDKDDFYAYMYDANTCKESEKNQNDDADTDLEILNFEKRITRGKFRPVLKQLKDRIDPIRKVMLDKEREVLAAKGFDVDELFKQLESGRDCDSSLDNKEVEEGNNNKVTSSPKKKKQVSFADDSSEDEDHEEKSEKYDSSDGSADEEYRKRSKKLKERDNFAEMRNFLAQKQAINIFNLDASNQPPLPSVVGDEDILESEC